MILTCSNCNTQFSVPDAALGTQGRKVKCSRCAHTWFQRPEPIAEDFPIIETDNGQPTAPTALEELPPPPRPAPVVHIAPPKQAGAGLKIAVIILGLLMVTSGGLAALPHLQQPQLLANLGLGDTKQYTMQKIGMKVTPTANRKQTLTFIGEVINNSDKTIPSPVVTIILIDKFDHKMSALPYTFPAANIEAGKSLPFEPKINNIPDTLGLVVLELGNTAEQLLR
jgi:predicted Zn finger-like uncharacterized protein